MTILRLRWLVLVLLLLLLPLRRKVVESTRDPAKWSLERGNVVVPIRMAHQDPQTTSGKTSSLLMWTMIPISMVVWPLVHTMALANGFQAVRVWRASTRSLLQAVLVRGDGDGVGRIRRGGHHDLLMGRACLLTISLRVLEGILLEPLLDMPQKQVDHTLMGRLFIWTTLDGDCLAWRPSIRRASLLSHCNLLTRCRFLMWVLLAHDITRCLVRLEVQRNQLSTGQARLLSNNPSLPLPSNRLSRKTTVSLRMLR